MLIIKIAVFLLLSTQLLAVQKSLKITCAACKTTPAGCTTGKCYQLTGKDLALESCAKAEICDFIKDGVTLTIGNCTVDF